MMDSHLLYTPTVKHPSNEVSITFGVDRIRFAKLIADNGPDILDTWEGQLAAVCDRELSFREIPFGTIWRTAVLAVGDSATYRGLELVLDVSVVGSLGTARVRLQIQEDELDVETFFQEEHWPDLVRNLLTFEVDHDDIDVDITDGGTTLDISLTIGSSTWVFFDVAKDLGSIAAAIVSAASDDADKEADTEPADAEPVENSVVNVLDALAAIDWKGWSADEIEAKQRLEDLKPWRTVLQEYLDDTCDWSGAVDVGPFAAFKKAVPLSVVREHVLRYEGEEMGAYAELENAVDRLEAEGFRGETIDYLKVRRDAFKRRMDWDGYEFDADSNKIFPPSIVTSEDSAKARKVQRAYDISMAADGGDPGLDLIRQRFIEAFGDYSADAT